MFSSIRSKILSTTAIGCGSKLYCEESHTLLECVVRFEDTEHEWSQKQLWGKTNKKKKRNKIEYLLIWPIICSFVAFFFVGTFREYELHGGQNKERHQHWIADLYSILLKFTTTMRALYFFWVIAALPRF